MLSVSPFNPHQQPNQTWSQDDKNIEHQSSTIQAKWKTMRSYTNSLFAVLMIRGEGSKTLIKQLYKGTSLWSIRHEPSQEMKVKSLRAWGKKCSLLNFTRLFFVFQVGTDYQFIIIEQINCGWGTSSWNAREKKERSSATLWEIR